MIGINAALIHEEMNKRIVKALVWNKSGAFLIPVELTHGLLALFAGLISFSIVKININFAYFFYSMSKVLDVHSQM